MGYPLDGKGFTVEPLKQLTGERSTTFRFDINCPSVKKAQGKQSLFQACRSVSLYTAPILAVEMSCPWTENREKKQEEKPIKYGPLRWELKQQFPGYDIRQYNIIIDVLGGWSTEVDEAMRELFGARGGEILLRMQRAVISHTLNIARTLKVMS